MVGDVLRCFERAAILQIRVATRDTCFCDLLLDLFPAGHNGVVAQVEYAGVIPESYSHDSSEEKLFAKYCDYLLAKALAALGMESSVSEERADAADVTASIRNYSVGGDAKAFRLSHRRGGPSLT